GLHVLGLEGLSQQRIVEQVDLPDRQVVGRPPPGVDAGQLVLLQGHGPTLYPFDGRPDYSRAGWTAASRSLAGPNVDSSHPPGSSPTAPVTTVDTPTRAMASAPRTTSSALAPAGMSRYMAVTSISLGSRPTSSQWRRRTSTLWATSSGPP